MTERDENLISVNPIWDGEAVENLSVNETLWDFDQLKVPALWSKYGVRGEGVNVYVIDSGVDPNHHAFAGNPVTAHSFMHTSNDPVDRNGHGTWCCGKIGGAGVGIAPKCKMYSLRTLDDNGAGYNWWTLAALEWIASQPDPHIVNMSLGSFYGTAEGARICKDLADRGVLLVAAAGNEDTSQKSYPAAYDGVLAVAAIDKAENRAWFSNYGEHIAVAAPGVSCYSTYLQSYFRKLQGTSMASPTVAGLLTLGASYLLKKNPSLGRATMRKILIDSLKTSAVDLGQQGKDIYYGYGGIAGEPFMKAVASAID